MCTNNARFAINRANATSYVCGNHVVSTVTRMEEMTATNSPAVYNIRYRDPVLVRSMARKGMVCENT